MSFHWWRVNGKVSDAPAAGKHIAEIDLKSRSLKVNRKLDIKEIAADYTVLITDTGKMLLITAACTITLPTPDSTFEGNVVELFVAADVTVTIATQTTDTLVTFNDIAADSIAFSTSSEKVGASVQVFCHSIGGTYKWFARLMTEETQTVTVAT